MAQKYGFSCRAVASRYILSERRRRFPNGKDSAVRGLTGGGAILCMLAGVALLGGCVQDDPDPSSAKGAGASSAHPSKSPSSKGDGVSSAHPSRSPSTPGPTESTRPTSSSRSSVPAATPAPHTPDDGVTRTPSSPEDPVPPSPKRKRKAVGWAGVYGSGHHDPDDASPWYVALARQDCGSVVAERDDLAVTKELVRGLRAVCPASDPAGQPDWDVAEEVSDSVALPDKTASCDESSGFHLLLTLVEMHRKDPDVTFRVVDDGPGGGSCKG